ncbi:MAG: hypothetical protein ACXWDS_04055 [Actinomycetota bacterium]
MAWQDGAPVGRGMRVGLSVGLAAEAEPARALYRALGYRRAHGPFLVSSTLDGDAGPIPVGALLDYLVKEP